MSARPLAGFSAALHARLQHRLPLLPPLPSPRLLSATAFTMSGAMYNPKAKGARPAKGSPPEPRPSASVVLLSPTNQILLLRRVKTSSSFPSAHVFPGGNLSAFHDGEIPPPGDPKRHHDSLPYRLASIRETFEESGILLARPTGAKDGPLLSLPVAERDRARRAIYKSEVRFIDWLKSVGGEPDIDNLHPFTRWITPEPTPKRFSAQMYLYMLPLTGAGSNSTSMATSTPQDTAIAAAEQEEAQIPTPDGSEVMTARFDDPAAWNARNMAGKSIMFPPQVFLIQMVGQFVNGPHPAAGSDARTAHYAAQRDKLLAWLNKVPTCTKDKYAHHPASRIPWADKCMSPMSIGLKRADSRAILTLDKPGRELADTDRGGDWERCVLVKFGGPGPTQVEIVDRDEIFAEMKADREKKDDQDGSGSKL
ncbi:IMP dehydrogenase [Microdochium nivale]|nr:IMP dehydrogenase [Microdochium nivale]